MEVLLPAATANDWALQPVQTAALVVDGQLQCDWRAFLQQLPNRHWVAVVRGPPAAAVDAEGVSVVIVILLIIQFESADIKMLVILLVGRVLMSVQSGR